MVLARAACGKCSATCNRSQTSELPFALQQMAVRLLSGLPIAEHLNALLGFLSKRNLRLCSRTWQARLVAPAQGEDLETRDLLGKLLQSLQANRFSKPLNKLKAFANTFVDNVSALKKPVLSKLRICETFNHDVS